MASLSLDDVVAGYGVGDILRGVHLAVAEPCQLAPGSAIRIAIDDGWVLPETDNAVDSIAPRSADRQRTDDGAGATSVDGQS